MVSHTETGPPGPTSRLEGKSISDVLMVEIFAGSARLAKACRHMGCRSVAVDKTTDRSHGTKIFVCDVTNPDDLDMLEQFLKAEVQNLGWVHFAPACGTASKAREKPNRVLERAGFHVPKPLRSEEHPLGLPHLSGIDLVRTQAANQVYEVTARLARLLISWGVFVTIENPTNSLFWLVPCIAQLLMDFGDTIVFSTTVAMVVRGRKTLGSGAPYHGYCLWRHLALVNIYINTKTGNHRWSMAK